MYLGYQGNKIKFYTEEELSAELYSLDRSVYTEDEYVFDGEEYVLKDEAWEEKQAQKERERLDKLSMTRGDVFEALILAKGLGKAQIRAMIEKAELDTVTKALYLNRFDEALEFYRGYPIFNMLGEALDITPSMLDRFFDEKDYHYLTKCKLTINPIPAEAKVTYDQNPAPYREVIHYKVELEGYKTVEGDFPIDRDFTVDIELEKIEEVVNENTTDTTTDIPNEMGE